MRLLLDTHAFIWLDDAPERLSRLALDAISDPGNELYLSVASVWEMQIKMQNRKLNLRGSLASVIAEQRSANRLRIEAVALEAIFELSALPPLHRDPFDRLLIAQARLGRYCLVTHDPEIARYDVATLW